MLFNLFLELNETRQVRLQGYASVGRKICQEVAAKNAACVTLAHEGIRIGSMVAD